MQTQSRDERHERNESRDERHGRNESTPTCELAQLRAFADVILAEAYHPGLLRQTLHQFEAWLVALSELPIDSESCRENIDSENGMALGPTWAAMCIEDIARTHCFVRGTHQAILACLSANANRPVHLLYAGCGPFATLVLPLLAHFSEQQLRLTLVDINPISIQCVQRLFARLNLQAYVEELLLADAVSMKIPKPDAIDIVLSETMQRALKNECQVQIMCNLIPQLRQKVLMLPERIILTLAQKDFSKPLAESSEIRPMESLGTLFELSAATIRKSTAREENGVLMLSSDAMTVTLAHANIDLYVLTSIYVFGDAQLQLNASGLTTPERIQLPPDLRCTHADHEPAGFPVHCRVRYVIDPIARVAVSFERTRAMS